ncbi:MAG: hypothetical protein HY226_02225 [Candidatus Vogelbacteria bacterium]|nr:hypothetical protein [Candidatus Vogelbacteria bacterium]
MELKKEFDGNIPLYLTLSKPKEQDDYKESEVYKLEQNGDLRITWKRDGWRGKAKTNTSRKVSLFTDGNLPINDRNIWNIIEELESIPEELLPARSLLAGEIVAHADYDDRGRVGSIVSKTDPEEIKEALKAGLLHYRLFDVFYLNGERTNFTFDENRAHLEKICEGLKYVKPVEKFDGTLDQFKEEMLWRSKSEDPEIKREGGVLFHSKFIPKCRIDGKTNTPRVKGAYKWKPLKEADFQALYVRIVDGKFKDIGCFQIERSSGKRFRAFHYGGVTKVEKERVMALPMTLVEKKKETIVFGWFKDPYVVQLHFTDRFEGSGKLLCPKQYEQRFDKGLENCICAVTYPEPEILDEEMYKEIMKP